MAGDAPWWAHGEDYGVLLYKVDGLIDVNPDMISLERETWLKTHGYVHVHEFVSTDYWVVYLKHTAVRAFYFDGGPMGPLTAHSVTPGIDYMFPNNWGPIP